MTAPKITLYVDTVSPFAYIAYWILQNDAAFKGCEVTYKPILLGGLFKACNNQPPLYIKNKDKWIDRERQRWAAMFNVPMHEKTPPNFPPRTLPIMRALAALDQIDSGRQERLVKLLGVLWDEFFVKHTATQEPAEMKRVLVRVLGEADAGRVIEASASDAGKKALNENTDAAFKDGAFGVPYFVCSRPDGQVDGFWGVDHLGQAAAFLGLEKPSTQPWKALL